MDQPITASPPTTGDLIDQFNQQAWSEADDWDGPTEAGLDLKAYVDQLERVPPEKYRQQRRQVRLLSILWPELKRWLESWDLGISFAAVYREAKQRVYAHVEQPTVEQTTWMDALLQEAEQQLPPSEQVVRSQTISMLSTMLSEADYQALAAIAAQGMTDSILKRSQLTTAA